MFCCQLWSSVTADRSHQLPVLPSLLQTGNSSIWLPHEVNFNSATLEKHFLHGKEEPFLLLVFPNQSSPASCLILCWVFSLLHQSPSLLCSQRSVRKASSPSGTGLSEWSQRSRRCLERRVGCTELPEPLRRCWGSLPTLIPLLCWLRQRLSRSWCVHLHVLPCLPSQAGKQGWNSCSI